MPRRLTEAQRRCFDREGLVFPLTVLAPAEAQHFRAAAEDLEAQMGGKPRTVEVRQMHLHFPWASALATHSAILDAVEDLLGPDLLIWATELFAKHPNDANVAIGWHRDQPYLGLSGGRTVTAWVALSDSTPANGCMRAMPRSAEMAAGPPLAAAALRKWTPSPEQQQSLRDVVLRPGEMSLHGADVLHGSGANPSADKRVGFVIRFAAADARPARGRPPVLLVRGRHHHEHFLYVEPPGPGGAAQALAGLRASAGRHLDAILDNLKHTGR